MKPTISLERNNSGSLFIGITEYDDAGYGIRSYVLSQQVPSSVSKVAEAWPADSVMERRFRDMSRLMDGNVQIGENALDAVRGMV